MIPHDPHPTPPTGRPATPEWVALAALVVIYSAVFLAFYPPVPGVEDETGFLNQALVWSRGSVSAEGAGFHHGLSDFFDWRGRHVPARHPGRSLAALPFLAAGGVPATFFSGLLLHLLMTLAGAALLARQGRSPLWAALLLFHPTLALYSRTIMADGPAGAILLLAALALAYDRPALTGIAMGLAAAMRYHAGMALPLYAGSFVYPREPDRTRKQRVRDALVCLVCGGLTGSCLVGYNLAVYGTYNEPFTGRRGVFGLEFLRHNATFYAAALMIVWPGMLLTPFFDRSRLRWLLRGSILIFLGPLLLYYFHDRAPGWVETAVLGQRLVQVVLPLWIVAYAGVLDDWLVRPLSSRLGPDVVVAFAAVGCLGLIGANVVASSRHQARLTEHRKTRDAIVKFVPADALVVHSGAVYKFVGTPSGPVPYYRLRPLDWMGYEVDPPETLDRDLARESRPWFLAVLRRSADEPLYPLVSQLIGRHKLRLLPLNSPFLALYSSTPGPGPTP